MLFNVNEDNKNKSGVYKICNLLNRRTYYGSAKDFSIRFGRHIEKLKCNKHKNKFLQNDYNKCKTEAFIFEILEITHVDERLEWEQIYLDEYWDNKKQCYNIQKKVAPEPKSFSKTPEETIAKISNSVKLAWENDPERRERLIEKSNSKEGLEFFLKHAHAKEVRERMVFNNSKTYVFINPKGEVISIFNLAKFCKENGLKKGSMYSVHNGQKTSCYGWRPFKEELIGVKYIKNIEYKEKKFKIKNPNGEIVESSNIKLFSKQNNLYAPFVSEIIRGIRKQHKGWTRAD